MKKIKKILAAVLAAVLPLSLPVSRMQVQANTSAMSPSYNTNVNYIAYATDVEDQAQTNYCWAYMADAVLESYLMKTQSGVQVDFSEWDMITQLSSGAYAFSDLYTGGNYHQAVAYWTRGSMYGPRLEANSSLTDYYVSETAELGRYDRDNIQSKLTYIQNIKNLVANYGAAGVSVYFTAEDRAMTTKDGAYFFPEQVSPGVNHGVTVVGWDDDFAPQWFYNSLTTPHQPQNKGAFLVKNSWGRDGSSISGSGYYWISYDNYFQDAFGVTQVLDRSRLYDRVYETDYRGLYDFWSGTSYSQTYQLSGGAQWLTGIATYVRGGASYQFFLDGKELPGCGGTAAQTGYHTFQLTAPVLVSGTMELRAEVTGSQDAVPAACSANSHEADGGNVCLKAFTKFQYNNAFGGSSSSQVWNPSAPSYTITGVTLAPQDCSVMQGTNRLFTAKVLGNGQAAVSQRINWQISGSSSPNTRISADGNLYVGADETSEVLYIYANSAVDSTQGASARVEVIKSGTSGSQTGSNNTNTWTSGTGTNINGTPITPPSAGAAGGTSTGTSTSGTVITGTVVTPEQSLDDNEDHALEDNAPVQIGTVDKGVYSAWKNGTAQYTKCTSSNHVSINIPATVKIGGETYEVNILDDGCIRNQKKVRSITIGKNVTQIGDESFYGCKQLKKVKILSEQIEYIGEDAFRGIAAKAVVYVPRSCLAEYREMVRESGNDTVRVKAYN